MATTVLQVGGVPPSIADVLALKYEALVLPINAEREDFLAEHAASITTVVDARPF